MTNAATLGRVDFARGARDYVNAVDMICVAPVSPEDDEFTFRFRSFVHSPGHWVDLCAGATLDHGTAAELKAQRGGVERRYAFRVEDDAADLARRPDVLTGMTPDRVQVDGNRACAPLDPGVEFWSQMTDCLRHFGWQLFGIDRWAVLGVSGSGACLRPLPGRNVSLRLDLQGTRAGIHRLNFQVEGSQGRFGRLLCAPRPQKQRT